MANLYSKQQPSYIYLIEPFQHLPLTDISSFIGRILKERCYRTIQQQSINIDPNTEKPTKPTAHQKVFLMLLALKMNGKNHFRAKYPLKQEAEKVIATFRLCIIEQIHVTIEFV